MRNDIPTANGHQADAALGRRVDAIIERSTPMWMRCASVREERRTEDGVSARLARWQTMIASDRSLRRRLANSGLKADPQSYLSCDGDIDLPFNATWSDVFTRVLETTTSIHSGQEPLSADLAFDPDQPIPFGELLVGFMRVGRIELQDKGGSALDILKPNAKLDFERQLLRHLAYIGSLALGKEWYLYRFDHAPVSSLAPTWSGQPPSSELYQGFIRSFCRSDGLLPFFEIYPVLARLMTRSVINWASFVVEFCQRFEAD